MSETREGLASKHWTIDKRVPLALILTISIQTCGIVWWASGLTTRVEVRLDKVVDGISEIKALARPPSPIIPK